MMVKNRSTKCS